jgi:hypothetical protein
MRKLNRYCEIVYEGKSEEGFDYIEFWKDYWNSLNKEKESIDNILYSLYFKYDRFHDFLIREIKFNPQRKRVTLKLNGWSDEENRDLGDFKLYFNNVTKFSVENELDKEKYPWKECIILSEIGAYDGHNYLGILTLFGTSIDIEFDSVTLSKSNIDILK